MKEKIFNGQNGLFYTGAIITIFSAIVIGAVHVGVFYLLGIPVFLYILGISLVWISKKAVKVKSLVTLISIGLMPLTLLTLSMLSRPEPEVFLIPENFRGRFVIYYQEPCGQKTLYETGKRIYEIPQDGVLITNFKENKGFMDHRFYLVNEKGDRTRIPTFYWQSFESEKENWKYMHTETDENFTTQTVGVFTGYGSETYWISSNSDNFIVSDFSYYDKGKEREHWLEDKVLTKRAEKILKECRSKL